MIKHFKAKLIQKINIVSDIWELRFEPDQEVTFMAGQYMILKVGDKRRLYSVASPQHITAYFDLLVQLLPQGVGSDFFRNLKVGEMAEFMGPAGQFVIRNITDSKIFLATGTGIAPIRSKIEELLRQTNKEQENLPEIVLFWGMKTLKDSYYLEEFIEKMQHNPHFKFYLCLTRENDETVFEKPYIKKGRVQEVLTRFMHGHQNSFPNEYEYAICGSREMVTNVNEFLLTKNVEKQRIYFEKF
jgi:CDP-4-dehydro-6-deoxyglucose reductase